MIEFVNVNKWYGQHHVLNNVNERVERGQVVVICGPSGSGKSTLIRTVNRLEPIEKGHIIVDDVDVNDKKISVNRLRSGIGFVFQQFNLFPHLSVKENVALLSGRFELQSNDQMRDDLRRSSLRNTVFRSLLLLRF